MKLVWTQHASDRLNAIFDFIQKDSIAHASEFCVRLIDATEQLEAHPLSGPVLPEDPAYRQLVIQEYRIAYKVTQDIVCIQTIVAPGMTYEHAI